MCDDFKVISYKKKGKHYRKKPSNLVHFHCDFLNHQDINDIIRRIETAKEDIVSSPFFHTFKENFGRISQQIKDIISYGLGQFTQCVSSRYQLAFLLALRDHSTASVELYDPVFSTIEVQILNHFNCKLIEINEEGKREVEVVTLFFLPHCPKQLINNLLWKNWGRNLSKCVIVGNSFSRIVQSHPNRFLKENVLYVYHSSTFVTEITIDNLFKYSDIFNDLAIHTFTKNSLDSIDIAVLNLNQEPSYVEEDIEFVTNTVLAKHLFSDISGVKGNYT